VASLPVSVNLFPRQIVRRDLASIVGRLLDASRIDARLLRIEITEAALLHNPQAALRTLEELRELGVSCLIDDFGSGHSSLPVLRRLPLHALKIGRSLVAQLPTDADAAAISRATIGLARGLGLQTVAVGVESERQLAFLREHGCELAQGYHFARPMPAWRIPLSGRPVDPGEAKA
jgi:EAL domain-containing protein (putative c-di-GMP-specific phosphodiesterase class I)